MFMAIVWLVIIADFPTLPLIFLTLLAVYLSISTLIAIDKDHTRHCLCSRNIAMSITLSFKVLNQLPIVLSIAYLAKVYVTFWVRTTWVFLFHSLLKLHAWRSVYGQAQLLSLDIYCQSLIYTETMQGSMNCKITCSGDGRPPLYQQRREGGCSNRLESAIAICS